MVSDSRVTSLLNIRTSTVTEPECGSHYDYVEDPFGRHGEHSTALFALVVFKHDFNATSWIAHG